MTKVDILVPYWGEFALLKETVDSVMAQTSDDWHLTVIDDAYSSDEASRYFEALDDPRVTYIRHPKNIGITNNFNYCVSLAKAEYCVLLGCDDRLLPNYVSAALKHIGDADFYQPGVEVIDASGDVYSPLVDRVKKTLRPRKPGVYRGESLALSLSRGNWLYFPSIMWRTSSLGRYEFDAKYKVVEDVLVEMQLIIDGGTLYLDNTTTFQYRRSAESVSSKEKTGKRFQEEQQAYDILAKKFTSIGWRKAARTANFRLLSRIHKLLS